MRRPCHAIRAVESWSRARHARTCATTAAAVAVPRALTTMAARRLRSCSFSLSSSPCRAAFHSSPPREKRATAHNNEEVPEGPPTTDFGRMDVLGNTPVPSTSVDFCMSDGFQLNSGTKILGGDGVLLIGGQAFAWRPWGPGKTFVNAKGQWEVDNGAFGLLGLVWPRPGRCYATCRLRRELYTCVQLAEVVRRGAMPVYRSGADMHQQTC